jgi:hypothetical protein
MYLQIPSPDQPPVGTSVAFELAVPPGEGYSALAGTVRGRGRVVRSAPASGESTGVAVQFTKPLALEF